MLVNGWSVDLSVPDDGSEVVWFSLRTEIEQAAFVLAMVRLGHVVRERHLTVVDDSGTWEFVTSPEWLARVEAHGLGVNDDGMRDVVEGEAHVAAGWLAGAASCGVAWEVPGFLTVHHRSEVLA